MLCPGLIVSDAQIWGSLAAPRSFVHCYFCITFISDLSSILELKVMYVCFGLASGPFSTQQPDPDLLIVSNADASCAFRPCFGTY